MCICRMKNEKGSSFLTHSVYCCYSQIRARISSCIYSYIYLCLSKVNKLECQHVNCCWHTNSDLWIAAIYTVSQKTRPFFIFHSVNFNTAVPLNPLTICDIFAFCGQFSVTSSAHSYWVRQAAFSAAAPTVWNAVPNKLRQSSSLPI